VRMAKVLGRTDDMLIVRGVNVFPSQIETVILQVGEAEPHYQIVVDRSSALDEIEVLVEVSAEIFDDAGRLGQLEVRLNSGVASILGISCRVRVVGPRQIPRSEGKAVRVVDRRR
jgi:phenylacetate-CoA ligase